MPHAPANVRAGEDPAEDLLAAYAAHLRSTGHGNSAYFSAARSFVRRFPDPNAWAAQSLEDRLAEDNQTRPFVTFLVISGRLRPGYDYLVRRKLSSFWREIAEGPIGEDLTKFRSAGESVGFTPTQMRRIASQSIGRVLIQSGKRLDQVTLADLNELAAACQARARETGEGWRHYLGAINCAQRVLFHLGVLEDPPPHWQGRDPFEDRLVATSLMLRPAFISYLECKAATLHPSTVSGLATRLAHFGRFLAECDPDLASLALLDRRRHIEPYLNATATAISPKNDEVITRADQARRILTVSSLLSDITEWGWEEAPTRRLIFRSDIPRLPVPLPRYLPIDADRRLGEALEHSEFRLAADALLLQRGCGLRIGELLDLELDCVHELQHNGAWLKVPLGKLMTERMVPLDDETVALIDRIVATRSGGRALRHPRTGKPAEFLFTHHGRRLGQQAVRAELDRAAATAGIGHVTSHQLRHTFATAMVNAGVSLQALMALLGHVSAEMSLRYGRLFDQTVRAEYERALDLAKARIGPLPEGRTRIPLTSDTDWRDAPAIKSRLAAGYCLRAPAQGSCPYANICEHCPNLRTDAASISVLSAQRVDAKALAADAAERGWVEEADRHRRLIERLDMLLEQSSSA